MEPTRRSPREILDRVAHLLEANSDLSPMLLSAEEVADCAGGLGCLSRRAKERAPVEHLLLFSVIARPGQTDLASALLVAADRALACETEQPEAIDLCASERALVAEMPRTEISELEDFDRAFMESLGRVLFERKSSGRESPAVLVRSLHRERSDRE